jgi:hypothetical protein
MESLGLEVPRGVLGGAVAGSATALPSCSLGHPRHGSASSMGRGRRSVMDASLHSPFPAAAIPRQRQTPADRAEEVGFEPAVSLRHSPRSWPGRRGDLRFLRTVVTVRTRVDRHLGPDHTQMHDFARPEMPDLRRPARRRQAFAPVA